MVNDTCFLHQHTKNIQKSNPMLKDSPFELLNCEELPGNPGKSLDRWKQGPAPIMDKCI